MAHTVLLLRIVTIKHTIRYWIWQLQVSQIDSINLVITSIETLRVYLSVQLIVKHLMISSLRLWHSIGILLIHHNYWHRLQSFGTHFSGNIGKVSWHECLVALQDMSKSFSVKFVHWLELFL